MSAFEHGPQKEGPRIENYFPVPEELETRIKIYGAMALGAVDGHAFTRDGLIVSVLHTASGEPLEPEIIDINIAAGLQYEGPLSHDEAVTRRAHLEAIQTGQDPLFFEA